VVEDKMKRFSIFLIALLLILSACMGATPMAQPALLPPLELSVADAPVVSEDAQEITEPPQPQAGGHLHIPMSLPRTLNPLLNSDPWVARVLRLIYEPLVIFSDDMRPIPNPAITQSIIFAEDARNMVITLRPDIMWEDGTPITSADIAFSIDVLRRFAPATAIYVPNIANFASISIIDVTSIQINLHHHTWAAIYDLAFPIISAVYHQGVNMRNLTAPHNMHPVGNGPLRFHSYELATSLELIVNHAAVGGRPYIQRVTAVILRDLGGNDRRYAFEQGLASIFLGEPALWGRYAADGKNRAADIVSNNFDFISFNFNRNILTDINTRSAIAHSFDADAILRRHFTVADGAIAPVNPSSWLNATDVPMYDFDLERAAEIFAELGFSKCAEGFLERRLSEVMPPIRLSMDIAISSDNIIGMSIADTLSNGLSEIGVDVSVIALPFARFMERVSAGDFDLAVGGMSLATLPNLDFLSSGAEVDNITRALFGYYSDALNELLYEKSNALNETAFRLAMQDIQRYIASNLPILGVGFHRHVLYTSGHIHGEIELRHGDVFANISGWFIAE